MSCLAFKTSASCYLSRLRCCFSSSILSSSCFFFNKAFYWDFCSFSCLRFCSSYFLRASTAASSSMISFFSASRSAADSSPVTIGVSGLGVVLFCCISGNPGGAVVPSLGVVIFCYEVWFSVPLDANELLSFCSFSSASNVLVSDFKFLNTS